MSRIRAYFRAHPQIHKWIHRLAFAVGGVLLVQDKILGASAFFPADSMVPRVVAYGLGVLAFSNLFIGAADQQLDNNDAQAAAPAREVPKSEAITEELPESEVKK